MVLVPFCSLLDPARAYSLVSAIGTLLLEGFATPEYANSHSPKLIDQDFCRHYESLGSAKAGFGLGLQQEIMRPVTCNARGSGVARDTKLSITVPRTDFTYHILLVDRFHH